MSPSKRFRRVAVGMRAKTGLNLAQRCPVAASWGLGGTLIYLQFCDAL
jgi:hypothetical protein